MLRASLEHHEVDGILSVTHIPLKISNYAWHWAEEYLKGSNSDISIFQISLFLHVSKSFKSHI